ncbi:hypothetical protein B0A55_02294 [Friedmanniomyces simplex]|uniref:F-box domain-containing protein n=1 Tax=Friedmanniomyces simplex TaxID=329884 RepID=A0A4U0XX86_9PEZI|nr:hypothetical protein B0A55_02294 [Friedmanniomyces simplex]
MSFPAQHIRDHVASSRVFEVSELFEHIMVHVDPRTLLLSQRVAKVFRAKILGSSLLRRKLCLREALIGPIKEWVVDLRLQHRPFIISDRIWGRSPGPPNFPMHVYRRHPFAWNDLLLEGLGLWDAFPRRVYYTPRACFRMTPLLSPQHVHPQYADMYLTSPPMTGLRVRWESTTGAWVMRNLVASDGVGVSFSDLVLSYTAAATQTAASGMAVDVDKSHVELPDGAVVTDWEVWRIEKTGVWPNYNA